MAAVDEVRSVEVIERDRGDLAIVEIELFIPPARLVDPSGTAVDTFPGGEVVLLLGLQRRATGDSRWTVVTYGGAPGGLS